MLETEAQGVKGGEVKITDKMRLEWMFDSATPLYANRGMRYVLHIKRTLMANNDRTYRQAVDAAIRSERKPKSGDK